METAGERPFIDQESNMETMMVNLDVDQEERL